MRLTYVLALVLVTAGIALLFPREGRAETAAGDDTVAVLARAVEHRLTVWRTPEGDPVHVGHCRSAQEGCRGRIVTFARWLVEIARRYAIDPFLLAAVAMRESGFDPRARGSHGERGIVQLHPRGVGRGVRYVRSEAYRARCLRTPGACQREVIEVGARHLAAALGRCGSVPSALGAYNSGECRDGDYADKVLEERDRLLRLSELPFPRTRADLTPETVAAE